jgi:hypothetical protein
MGRLARDNATLCLLSETFNQNYLPFAKLWRVNILIQELRYHLLVLVPQDIANNGSFAVYKMQFSAIAGVTILAFSMSNT